MSDSKKYLKQKNGTWYLQIRVPTKLANHPKFIGKDVYTVSLKTKILGTAKHRRDTIIDEIHALMEGSKSVDFMLQTAEFRESNRQFLTTHAHNEGDLDAYSITIELLEQEARTKYRLPLESPDLPEHLRLKRDALIHANRLDIDPTAPTPFDYGPTLKDMMKRTIENKQRQGRKESSLKKYPPSISLFLDFIGAKDIPVAKISRRDSVEFCQAMQNTKSGSTVSGYMSSLSEVWKTARDLEHVSGDNPFKEHQIKDDSEPYLPWSAQQILDLYELVGERTENRAPRRKFIDEDRLLFRMGYYTGARIEELHSLTDKSLVVMEGEDGREYLSFNIKPAGDGKNKSSTRFVPVHPALLDDMKTFKGFSGKASSASKRFGRIKAKYLGENNSDRYVFHSLRHVVSTELYRAGFDTYFVGFIVGHSQGTAKTELQRTYIHGPTYQRIIDALYGIKTLI